MITRLLTTKNSYTPGQNTPFTGAKFSKLFHRNKVDNQEVNKYWDELKKKLSSNVDYPLADYEDKQGFCKDISKIMNFKKEGISTFNAEGWHCRLPDISDNKIPRATHTASLNTYPAIGLITELDDFLLKHKSEKICYKVPDALYDRDGWMQRSDSVIINFPNKPSNKQKEDLKKIASRYLRDTQNNQLSGEKIADGIALRRYPTKKEIKNLVKKSRKTDLNLGVVANKFSEGGTILSVGEYYVIKEMIKEKEANSKRLN